MMSFHPVAHKLSRALQFQTVSYHDQSLISWEAYHAFAKWLEEAFPLCHSHLHKAVVNQHGLVFHWPGQGPQKQLPILLTAHYDVVPVRSEGWPEGPFSGTIKAGKIWGRGSLDDKASLIAILQSVEDLLEHEQMPQRAFYLAFGFDEECNGLHGAHEIAAYFAELGLKFEFVLDEGGAVADGSLMGIDAPVAVIGVAEKGHANYEFQFSGEEGHSSAPPPESSVSQMAAFIRAVQDHPLPCRMTEALAAMLQTIAPHTPVLKRFLLRHPYFFFPLIKSSLAKNRQTAAMLRSTVTFTMSQAGHAANVLPKNASCTANIRLLQGDSSASVLAHLKQISPFPFTLKTLAEEEATPVSSLDSPAFKRLTQSIRQIFPDAVPTPYLMVGGTDCRKYQDLAQNCYRFLPCRLSAAELSLMHASGEYISLDNLERALNFYSNLLQNLD